MTDDKHIGDLARESDIEEECTANHFIYDINSKNFFVVRDDGSKEPLPVKRYKGHFDKDQHYVIESISEPR